MGEGEGRSIAVVFVAYMLLVIGVSCCIWADYTAPVWSASWQMAYYGTAGDVFILWVLFIPVDTWNWWKARAFLVHWSREQNGIPPF